MYESGETDTHYYIGMGIHALERENNLFYYHQDEQLNTAFVTNDTGMVSNSYTYDAFGAPVETAEQISNRIRYTGQQYDTLTGQYYLRARYYNPALGRFLQEDSYLGDGLNLYAYCGNNPVVYYDPSGYKKECSKAKQGEGQGEGLCVELNGNAFSEIGSPYYEAHRSLERFWNQYRPGGDLYREYPAIGEYNRAVYNSLLSTNKFTPQEAAYAVRRAYGQQHSAGFTNSDFVPRIPGKLPQKK